ncbi:MAG TPA: indole-3-glycerol phosphate synthase TrpC [Candidatus Obscuribacterales bacterium]
MSSVLDEILDNKRKELQEKHRTGSLAALKELATVTDGAFKSALDKEGVNIVAEIKPRSPSMGTLRKTVDLTNILASYGRYARAISVLTDQKYFGGSIDLLAHVSTTSHLPTLCKDFILDPRQCYEARIAGAGAVLLIVKALDDALLGDLHSTINELGMTAVVEVQNENELERALAVNPSVILVNNRNLDTMKIDLATSERLVPLIPKAVTSISASGIESRADIERLLPICNNFLIGSSLMQSENIEAKLQELIGVTSVC